MTMATQAVFHLVSPAPSMASSGQTRTGKRNNLAIVLPRTLRVGGRAGGWGLPLPLHIGGGGHKKRRRRLQREDSIGSAPLEGLPPLSHSLKTHNSAASELGLAKAGTSRGSVPITLMPA